MQHIFLKGAVTILLLLLLTTLAWGQASVPNLINFQGRLTDASGNPVADGSHTVNYTIWDLPTAGTNLWTENTSQTTSGGLFTHQLGSTVGFPLPPSLFQSYDSLYLQIQADGQIILPRIRLTSTPYTRLADNLEVRSTFLSTPSVVAASDPYNNALIAFGDDGTQNCWLGGPFFGVVALYDEDASNDLTALLLANSSSGGELVLSDNAGSTVIDLHGGLTGDASAVFPSDAINATEMSNEPGVAHRASLPLNTFRAIPSGINALDSISITAPSSGYVLVFGALSAVISHTNGTVDDVYFQLMNTPGSIVYTETGFALYRIPSVLATSTDYCQYLDLSRVFTVASAGTYKFYLNARVFTGWDASDRFVNAQLSAVFIPTLYGTVDVTNLANTGASSSNLKPFGDEPSYEVQSITVEEHNARLEAEVAKVKAELEARLQKLEHRLDRQAAGVE